MTAGHPGPGPCDSGCRPVCAECGRAKAPVGRSVALAMAGGLCDDDCPGYRRPPTPCDLWPGEKREGNPFVSDCPGGCGKPEADCCCDDRGDGRVKTPAEIGRRWQDHYLTHPGDDVEECVSAAIRERDAEHAADAACVLCPDQDDNDNARGYCADHGTEMRDRLDAALGLLTRWLSQHRDGGSTDPCGVATELVDETMQAVVRR